MVLLFLGSGLTLQAQSLYTITKIGPIAGHNGSWGHAINNAGEVAGWSNTIQAYHWSDGELTGMPPLPGGDTSRGEGIGESGVILGSANSGTDPEHAVIWFPSRAGWTPVDLGVGSGDLFSLAEAVNSSGVICGYSDDAVYSRAAVWDPVPADSGSYQISILPFLTDHFQSLSNDINDDEIVVGMSLNFFSARAASWARPGGVWQITDLGALHANADAGANAVNNEGTIVGWSVSPVSGMEHAVLWEADSIVDLGRVEGQRTYANGINNIGDVVGEYWNVGFGGGFVREAGQTTLHDLQELIPAGSPWTIKSAQDINDSGQITGFGEQDGFIHSFLLTPITLMMTGPTPGIAGEDNTWEVSGATPDKPVYFFFALNGGETPIPGYGKITLDLANPRFFGSVIADETGNVSHTFFVPARAAGLTVLFQALDYRGRMVSNVTQHTF
jgi:probable HAF family extracellular repeat protein